MPSRPVQQRGVTLVELMIALVLALVLAAGVIQIFIGNRVTYAFNEALARLQENGRFAIDTLNYRVRMAGYFGCLPDVTLFNNLDASSTLEFNFDQALMGYEAAGTAPTNTYAEGSGSSSWSPALPSEIASPTTANTPPPRPGSDVIVIYNASASAHGLVAPFTSGSQVFVDATPDDYEQGEIGIVSDCQKASVFQMTNVSNNSSGFGININHSNDQTFTPGNQQPTWGADQMYGLGAELLRAETWVFYVGETTAGRPALIQRRLQHDTAGTVSLIGEELVEGVDTMQILYGVDTTGNNSADQYVVAGSVTDWDRVLSVRIGLLMRGPEEYGTEIDNQTYNVNGMTYDPVDDRRVRQVFTTTVALRNRLP